MTSASTTGVALGDAQAAVVRPPGMKLDKLTRADFNRIAAELALPIFWAADTNKDNALDGDELAVYWGLVPGAKLVEYVGPGGAFTDTAKDAIEAILKQSKESDSGPGRSADAGSAAGLDPKEVARRAAVKKELAQGRVTLVETDLTKAAPEEKRFVGFITQAAELIEKLYAKQEGTLDLRAKVPADDTASRSMFFRNQGAEVRGAADAERSGVQRDPRPAEGQALGLLSRRAPREAEVLRRPVEARGRQEGEGPHGSLHRRRADGDKKGAFKAVPYHEAFKDDVTAISGQLKAAAEALGTTEPALKAYLLATAQAFTDDKWWPADEAWAKMDAKNSKYYIRVAADEVYREPCSTKALYHVSFGLINQGSLKWQSKLDPIKARHGEGARRSRRRSVQGARGQLQAARLRRHRAQRG